MIDLIKQDFESSSGLTPQFKEFYDEAKKYLKKTLKPHVKRMKFDRGHFTFSMFVEANSGKMYYMSIADVRSLGKHDALIRKVESFTDYVGGNNNFISIDKNFSKRLVAFITHK